MNQNFNKKFSFFAITIAIFVVVAFIIVCMLETISVSTIMHPTEIIEVPIEKASADNDICDIMEDDFKEPPFIETELVETTELIKSEPDCFVKTSEVTKEDLVNETVAITDTKSYAVSNHKIEENNEANFVEDDDNRYLGTFTLTAYCGCSKCCDEYGLNRPVDENGNPIVYTASGAVAKSNHTIAVDPSIIPYGAEVIINGNTYVAEDCGGAIKGNRIDIYFDNHSDAWNFGRQTADVYLR